MTDKERILIVDDEDAIRHFLSKKIARAGYVVLTAASGEEALVHLQQEPIDLVLLDLKMDGLDGLQVMAKIEELASPPIIIILTAHATLDSAIHVMRHGGFDYLRKPCHSQELLACLERGLARRRQVLHRQYMLRSIEETVQQLCSPALAPGVSDVRPARFLEGHGLLLDRENKTVTRHGQPLTLTPTEFQLLACLMEQAGQPVSYRELVGELYPPRAADWQEWESRQALSTHLWRLRHKLGQVADGRPYIANVRGQGYKFIASPSLDPH